jgi:diguanylate cyclase (GGDEF)-like protein
MHLAADHAPSTLCVPMMAHGDVVGLLHLRHGSGPVDPRLPGAIADQVALSIANLKLRDTLRSQSIRDPVTSLFNRRYLEETLEREVRRAARGRQSIGLILIDLDRFKLLNDTHGHQAGDLVLQDFGAFLNRSIRGGDVACRYGGEEFVLVLPESALTSTAARAESLRAEFRTVRFTFAGQPIGPVTFSAGVAAYPDHGATASDLLSAADGALYQSKHNGRDRVTTADMPAPEPKDGTSPE